MASRLAWAICVLALVSAANADEVGAEISYTETCPAGTSVPVYGNCTGGHTGCCEAGLICYKQDDEYAQCREPDTCPCSTWDCTELEAPCFEKIPEKGNCRTTGCCEDGLVCYEQDQEYAQCLRPGMCPNCSAAWTCDIVRRTPLAGFHTNTNQLKTADGNVKAEEAITRDNQAGSGGAAWKKIVGGVGAGVGALALVASVSMFVAKRRRPIPAAVPPRTAIKTEMVYATGSDGFEVDSGIKQRRPPRDVSEVAAVQL